jgi:hypothetical protein
MQFPAFERTGAPPASPTLGFTAALPIDAITGRKP